MEDEGNRACTTSVRHVGGEENDYKGDQVRRCAEGLRGEGIVTHLVKDLGEEDREGRVGHVSKKEHGRRDPGDGITKDVQQVTTLEARGRLTAVAAAGLLIAETQPRNLFLALGQIRSRLGRVGYDVPGYHGDQHGGETLNEEQQAPGRNGTELGKLDNDPRECRGKARRQRSSCACVLAINSSCPTMELECHFTGYEDGRAEGQFVTLKEEAQVEGNARKASLANTEKDAQEDQHRVRRGDGLQRRRKPPGEDDHGHEDVGGYELPQQRHPLKSNIRDVKGRQCPFVPVVAGW